MEEQTITRIRMRKPSVRNYRELYQFFLILNRDIEARKYCRYLMCNTLFSRIRCLITLFFKSTFNNITCPLTGYMSVFTEIFYDELLVGICHIDIDLWRKMGVYGIAILKPYRGKRLDYKFIHFTIKLATRLLRSCLKRILLKVDEDNIRANRLYKALGFKLKYVTPL